MILLFFNFILIPYVFCAPPDCLEKNAFNCLKGFSEYMDEGVSILENADSELLAKICLKYNFASDCITPFLYFCPKIKKSLHKKLEEFEYACLVDKSESESWPHMPTVGPKDGSIDEISAAQEAEEKRKLFDSAIKASIAAGVTLLLIFACFLAECISQIKIRRRINKATALSDHLKEANVQTDGEDDVEGKLIKKV